ncbi:MAG: TylF/MycF/NovP-related O-methyltransferase [Bacteroidota bacterium]
MQVKTPEELLRLIKPPARIHSWEQLDEVIQDDQCLSLIEKPFFDQIKAVVQQIATDKVEGDVVIAGVFKGGAALYLKALFEEAGMYKKWWLLDSFDGFNEPTLKRHEDINSLQRISNQVIRQKQPDAEEIYQLFKNNGLENNLEIVAGFFEDTFSKIDCGKICLLHIDVDFYEPTLLCLDKFYGSVEPNGWAVVDDYYAAVFKCRDAVDQYREQYHISEEMIKLGNYPAAWKKQAMPTGK